VKLDVFPQIWQLKKVTFSILIKEVEEVVDVDEKDEKDEDVKIDVFLKIQQKEFGFCVQIVQLLVILENWIEIEKGGRFFWQRLLRARLDSLGLEFDNSQTIWFRPRVAREIYPAQRPSTNSQHKFAHIRDLCWFCAGWLPLPSII